jgi:hypothetical protein
MLYEAGQGPAFLFAYSVVLGPLSQKAVIDPILPVVFSDSGRATLDMSSKRRRETQTSV